MSRLPNILFLSATLGLLGGLLPWFRPGIPGLVADTWHSWDSVPGVIACAVPIFAGCLGWLLRDELAGKARGDSRIVGDLLDKLLWLPLVGIAAAIWTAIRLPDNVVLQTCYGTLCDQGSSSWIDVPGASRGTQFGFWLIVFANLVAAVAAVVVFRQSEQMAELVVENRYPTAVERPRPRAMVNTKPSGCVAVPRHGTQAMSATGTCSVCFPRAAAIPPAQVPPRPSDSLPAPGCIAHPPHLSTRSTGRCATCFPTPVRLTAPAPLVTAGGPEPMRAGWYRRFDDEVGVRRWHDGRYWTGITRDDGQEAPSVVTDPAQASAYDASAPQIAENDPTPTRAGWYRRFDDAATLRRWHDGTYWTDITRDDAQRDPVT